MKVPGTSGLAAAGLGMVLAMASGCGAGSVAGAGLCHDDSPPLSSMFYEGGSECTLPDGGAGVGAGQLGCIDSTICHCRAEAGPATCAAGAVCVYAACNGANPGAACSLSGGGQGTCCNGVCSAVDLRTDPSNCGGCGFVCPEGVSCADGFCNVPAGASSSCPSGAVLAQAVCLINGRGSTCLACVPASCAGLPDDAPCVSAPVAGQSDPVAGFCCQGACVAALDNQNCGGCGVTCCAGTQCWTDSPTGFGPSFGNGGWCYQ